MPPAPPIGKPAKQFLLLQKNYDISTVGEQGQTPAKLIILLNFVIILTTQGGAGINWLITTSEDYTLGIISIFLMIRRKCPAKARLSSVLGPQLVTISGKLTNFIESHPTKLRLIILRKGNYPRGKSLPEEYSRRTLKKKKVPWKCLPSVNSMIPYRSPKWSQKSKLGIKFNTVISI